MNPISTYPNNLRLYRKQARLRQIDVAQALKLDCADRISRWETGVAIPSIINLFRLAILYKVSPQDLFPETWRTVEKQLLQGDSTSQIFS